MNTFAVVLLQHDLCGSADATYLGHIQTDNPKKAENQLNKNWAFKEVKLEEVEISTVEEIQEKYDWLIGDVK
jgi:hypothetical protein